MFEFLRTTRRPSPRGNGGALTFTLWVVCLIATSSLLKHLPSYSLSSACFQEGALALVCCAALLFAWHQGGGLPKLDGTSPLARHAKNPTTKKAANSIAHAPTAHAPVAHTSTTHISTAHTPMAASHNRAIQAVVVSAWVVAVGAAAFVLGPNFATCSYAIGSLDAGILATRFGSVLIICLLTALAEEALCRGLCFPGIFWLVNRSGATKRVPAVLLAALVSSLFFALPHVSTAALGGSLGFATCLAGWAKLAQSAVFGFIAAFLYWKTRSFMSIVAVHALFDLVYLGPQILAAGTLPSSYLAGGTPELTVLALSTVALLPCAVWAARQFCTSVR